ncbi:MAG: PQQ-binding-like beta-propeller repeat protein [Rhodanobacteraceae bacterium]|nr:PQQ-binding-like beta-propeller repeat protein [Rhodanobacteraceae bacterium]
MPVTKEIEMKGIGSRVLAGLSLMAMLYATAATAWEDYPGFQGPGHAGIAIGDFDGNGKLEAAVTGNAVYEYSGSSELIGTLAADGSGKLDMRSMTMLPTTLAGGLVLAPREGSADRLAAVASEGTQILIFGGVPLRVLRVIEAPFVRQVYAITDVDGDGNPDIVATANATAWGSEQFPVVLDYASGAIKWMGAEPVSSIGVLQIEGAATKKLILGGTPGRVIDGASHAVEWTYAAGFGNRIVVGRFAANPSVATFASTSRWTERVQVFRAQPYSRLAEFPVIEVGAVATMQLTPGGGDQIAVGGLQAPGVVVYDPRTGQPALTVSRPESGVDAIAVGDLDGDGRMELVYGSGLFSSGKDVLRAVDLGTRGDDYTRDDEIGPHTAVARGDIAGGGSDQVVYLTRASDSGYGGSNVHVLDATSGKRLRSRRDALYFSWTSGPPSVAIAQMDGDAQQEIVIATNSSDGGVVAVLDGVTLQDQWRVSVCCNPSGLAVLDVNADGVPDVVTTNAGRVVVLDGRNGTLLWQSVTLYGNTPPSVAAFRTADGTPRVVVARGAALYVFDMGSQLLVSSAKTTAGLVGLRQWGDGTDCRLGALDEAAVVTIHRCDDLLPVGQYLMPEGTVFFRPANAQANRFVAASGAYLYEVGADGNALPLAGAMGYRLGAGNQGVLRADPDGQHFDLVIGSDYMVTRVRVGLDAMFANGFD